MTSSESSSRVSSKTWLTGIMTMTAVLLVHVLAFGVILWVLNNFYTDVVSTEDRVGLGFAALLVLAFLAWGRVRAYLAEVER